MDDLDKVQYLSDLTPRNRLISDQQLQLEVCYENIIRILGYSGPNFTDTPKRVARMMLKFTEPIVFNMTEFPLTQKGGMVFIKGHEAYSMCPHHMLPVKYICKIGYIPEHDVLGLSKLAWIADDLMRLMPLQEELPAMIGKRIQEAINPKGVGVIVNGTHLCMRMRGVESSSAEAVTSYMWGIFLTDDKARMEFLTL